ncbi:MAG: transposase, partial [Verrucomicrobia bacterium]|nr:transposase [Verrucomicrobiota bacterium]
PPWFSKQVWDHVQVLVVGVLLALGQRTVTAVLRVMRLSQGRHSQNYYRVLSRVRWSSPAVAHGLLELGSTYLRAHGGRAHKLGFDMS